MPTVGVHNLQYDPGSQRFAALTLIQGQMKTAFRITSGIWLLLPGNWLNCMFENLYRDHGRHSLTTSAAWQKVLIKKPGHISTKAQSKTKRPFCLWNAAMLISDVKH